MNRAFTLALLLWSTSGFARVADYEYEMIELGSGTEIQFFFERSGKPQGGILLTYAHQPPQLVTHLAHNLSRFGWSVAILSTATFKRMPLRSPPALDPSVNPTSEPIKDTGATSAKSDPGNPQETPEPTSPMTDMKKDPKPPDEKIVEAIQFLEQEKGQLNLVVLSLDRSWPVFEDLMVAKPNILENVQAYVLLNTNATFDLPKAFRESAYYDVDTHRQEPPVLNQRRVYANRFKLARYQQIHLPAEHSLHSMKEDRLARRIRGWLAVNVKGVELDKKGENQPSDL